MIKRVARVLITVVLSGCASAGVIKMNTLYDFPPTNEIEIIFNLPERPHKVIAIIEGMGTQYTSFSEVIYAMRRKAMRVGGHALLLFHSKKESVPTTYHEFLGTPITLAGGTKQNIRAFAIRYTDDSVPIDLRDTVQDTTNDTTSTTDPKPVTSPATHKW